jgi:small GTP-binding protein
LIAPVLDEAARALLGDERALLADLADWLTRVGVEQGTRRALEESLAQLEDPFLLVVVGEFNAGKSAFINALVGQPVLDEDVTPTTSRIGLVRHGARVEREPTAAGLERISAPAEALRDLVIVDTPGTNAVLREHETLTRDFVPRADLVVFVTSADRPFTESERAFLELIREWGKKVVLVLNKTDLLGTPAEVERVVGYVRDQVERTLGFSPLVFPVSARQAARGRAAQDAAMLGASGLLAFEAQVTATLDDAERLRLKLQNPLGIARRARDQAAGIVAGRLAVLAADVTALERIEADLEARAQELTRDFRFRLSDVEKVLLDFERRGNAFFDQRLRLTRVFELLDRDRLRRDFEQTVVAELPREVEQRVEDVVDWMVGAELRQWQEVMSLLGERPVAHQDRLVGRVEDRFDYDRQRMIDSVGAEVLRAVERYDAPAEARRLAQSVRDSLAQTALLQVSALGLGAVVATLATTTMVDVTGILAAGALSVLGFFVLPARRHRARAELGARVFALREKLMASLTASFERERDRAGQRVREAISPYARFVRTEQERLRGAERSLARLEQGIAALGARVAALGRG